MPIEKLAARETHIRHEAALAALRSLYQASKSPNPYVLSLRERDEIVTSRLNFNDASTVLLRMLGKKRDEINAIMEDTLSHAFVPKASPAALKTLLAYIASLPASYDINNLYKEQLAKVVLELESIIRDKVGALDIAKQNLFDKVRRDNSRVITQSTRIELDGITDLNTRTKQTVKDYYAVLDEYPNYDAVKRFDTPDLVLRFRRLGNWGLHMQERSEYFCSPPVDMAAADAAYSMLSLKFDILVTLLQFKFYSSIYYHFFPKTLHRMMSKFADREIHTAAVSGTINTDWAVAGDPYNLSTVYFFEDVLKVDEDYLFEMIKESLGSNLLGVHTIRFYDSDRNRAKQIQLHVDNILKREGNVEWDRLRKVFDECFKHVVIDRRFYGFGGYVPMGLVVAAEAMKNSFGRDPFFDDDTYSTGLYYDLVYDFSAGCYRDTGVKVAVEILSV
ncbi:hypothetical protein SPFM7_00006 [Salmonella phage SPFM7]|nr:hypothetical protein SPFM7_00006 [Salmonella phage SPFM7]